MSSIVTSETINAIQEALAPVAEKLGKGAAYLWEVAVRQQLIQGYVGLGLLLLFLIITIVVALVGRKLANQEITFEKRVYKNKYDYEDKQVTEKRGYASKEDLTSAGVVEIFAGVLAVIWSVTMTACIGDFIGRVVNPGWYAISAILNQVR